MKLSRQFYNRPTLKVAKELLGKYLVRKIGRQKLIGKIIETEAYVGTKDKASHASRGRTPRTELMFGPPGHAYIYLIYGMYYCLNIVTERKDFPSAVLIRALEPKESISLMKKNRKTNNLGNLTSGPGKLCQALKIDKKLNGISLVDDIPKCRLWIEKEGKIRGSRLKKKGKIIARPRIGVDYAGKWKDKKWRFILKYK